VSLFHEMKTACADDWRRYTHHPFVEALGAGTLPEAAFRRYLVQDYLFLIQFARANALAVYKSRRLRDMRAAQGALSAILDVELDLHIRVSARWGLSPGDMEAAGEAPATVAYTRFVLDCGMVGDLLDLRVALSPCVVGYGEIGARLLRLDPAADHPYRDWIAEYGGAAYQAVARAAGAELDALAERAATPARRSELEAVFAKATRLEADFWQAALDD